MRPLIIEAAKDKFGEALHVKQLVDLKAEEDEERKDNILIIGTIFKQQERKPSILSELSEEPGLDNIPTEGLPTGPAKPDKAKEES